MRKTIVIAIVVTVISMAAASTWRATADGAVVRRISATASREHTEWIAQSLRQIDQIHVGMTRADLGKVFTTEGGLSTPLKRTYVYRECPYIKVDVEFKIVGRPERDKDGRVTPDESPDDAIKTISKPYLQWTIAD